jgi:hypothetical protein
VPGAASQIGDRRAVAGLLGEAGQQGPVERLASQLVAEADRVFLGEGVITLADAVMLQDRALHDGSLYWPASRPVTGCRAGITEAIPDRCPVGTRGVPDAGTYHLCGEPRGETQAAAVGAFMSSSALACAGCTGPPLIARQLSAAAASTAIGSAMAGRMAST